MLGYARRSTVVPWARPIPYAGGLHARAPQPVPIRPFRRRVVTARAVARVSRKARASTKMACAPHRRCSVLLAQEWLRLADAAPGVSTLADGLLPLSQMAHRRPIA